MNEQTSSCKPDIELWLPLDDFIKSYPNFKRGQIEWLYRNREINGYKQAFKKIGKRRYIHTGIFSECIHGS